MWILAVIFILAASSSCLAGDGSLPGAAGVSEGRAVLLAGEPAGFGAKSGASTADAWHGDYRSVAFSAAFDSLFTKFSTVYPFTSWKAIDWQGLYDEFAPQVAAAQTASDTSAYKLAVRRFLHRFPDGHVRVQGDYDRQYAEDIGGGLGLTIVQLDHGSIAANRVLPGGPAQQAGMEVGAIINQWNGRPVNDALSDADIIWEGKPPATTASVRLAQLRRLVRATVGAQTTLTFANPGSEPITASLTAVDDGLETWNAADFSRFNSNGSPRLVLDDILHPVEYEILPSGYGYLKCRILVEFDAQGHVLSTYSRISDAIKTAIDSFNSAHVRGVIVDVRDNPGGYDRLAAMFGGFFYDHSDLYEHASFYNPQIGQFEVIGSFTVYVQPQASYYGGRVVCLVNAGTASSAEGVAMAIQKRPHGFVLGFSGTSGSFGLTSGESLMPGGLSISYPLGRSLDSAFNIQLDSDSTKRGGVSPDVLVPLTMANMMAKYADAEDVELQRAIEHLNGQAGVDDREPGAPVPPSPNPLGIRAVSPNPFNPCTTVWLDLPRPTLVSLCVLDLGGAPVRSLCSGWLGAGRHSVVWDGANQDGRPAAAGVYLFSLMTADGLRRTAKGTLLK